jgi:hypothetical protein
MVIVKDKFGKELFIGTLVAVATNSGLYVGRVTKFNISTWNGKQDCYSVQVQLTTGRKMSYDNPDERMANLDEIQNTVKEFGL